MFVCSNMYWYRRINTGIFEFLMSRKLPCHDGKVGKRLCFNVIEITSTFFLILFHFPIYIQHHMYQHKLMWKIFMFFEFWQASDHFVPTLIFSKASGVMCVGKLFVDLKNFEDLSIDRKFYWPNEFCVWKVKWNFISSGRWSRKSNSCNSTVFQHFFQWKFNFH